MTHFRVEKHFPAVSLLVSITYILVFSLSRWFPSLEITRSLLGFIILTYLLGATVRIFLKYVAKLSNLPSTLSIAGLACDILLSFLINLSFSTILIRTFLFYENLLIIAIITLINILNAIALLTLRRKPVSNSVEETSTPGKITSGSIGSFIILLVASTLFAMYFRSKTPIPTINGWDINPSLACINWIVSHHGYQYLFIPSFPINPLIPYPALFFYLVSSYSLFLGVEPFFIYWYSIYLLIFSYMTLVFLIALKMSGNHWLSLTSAFMAFFTSAALAEEVRTPLYLTLDMTGLLLFLLIIVFHIYYHNRGIEKKILNLCAITLLGLFNYLTFIAIFPFLLWIAIDEKMLPLLGDGRRVFRLTTVGMALSVPVLISLSSYISSDLASVFSPSTIPYLKIVTLQKIYPAYFWVMFSLAFFSVVSHQLREHKRESLYLDILLFICCSFVIYFYSAGITRRVEFYIRVFLAVFISGLVYSIGTGKHLITLRATLSKKERRINIRLGATVSFCLFLITVIGMYPLFTNYASNFQAFISKDEYDAAEWIKQNTSPTAYILTDYSSGYVFRGLSLRNSSIFFILPDGRMPADSFTLYPDLKKTLHDFFSSQSIVESVQILQAMPFNQIYIVVTSRTVFWALHSLDVSSTGPRTGMNYSQVINKFTEPYFFEKYSSNTVKIYKPNPSLRIEAIPIWFDDNFREGWSWYLDGAYKDYSSTTDGNSVKITVQAKSTENAWMGLTKQIPNCTDATYLQIRYKIDVPSYVLEVVLWDSKGEYLRILYLQQSSEWSEETLILTEEEASKVAKVGLIMWTRDTLTHTFEIDYILLGKIEAMP